MSNETRESAPLVVEDASQIGDLTDDTPKYSQRDLVLARVLSEWVCATTFLKMHIPRYGARLHEISRGGMPIERRVCADRSHQHKTLQYEWRVAPDFDLRLPGIGDV